MPNTTALLLSATQQSAGLAAKALAPSAAAAAGGATAGTLGTVLGAAVPILSIAAVAAPLVSNLISCGTLGTIGCTKTSDSNATEAIAKQAAQIGYQVEQGQITPAQGGAELQQILAQGAAQFQRPTDWTQSSGNPWYLTATNGWDGLPASSKAGQIDNGALVSPQQYVSDMLAYVGTIAPPAGSPAAAAVASSDPITAVTNAASAATGLPGWAVLAAAGIGIYFLVK